MFFKKDMFIMYSQTNYGCMVVVKGVSVMDFLKMLWFLYTIVHQDILNILIISI